MSVIRKTFRPSLEALEGRELMAANALASHALAPAVTQHAAAPVVQIDYAGLLASPASKSGIGFDQMTPDSVISLRNTSKYTVYWNFRWDNGSWHSGSLAPGQGWFYWDSGAGHKGYISFKKAVPAGCFGWAWQDTTYVLTSHTVLVGGFAGFTPQYKDGQLYTFMTTSYCPLDLYRS